MVLGGNSLSSVHFSRWRNSWLLLYHLKEKPTGGYKLKSVNRIPNTDVFFDLRFFFLNCTSNFFFVMRTVFVYNCSRQCNQKNRQNSTCLTNIHLLFKSLLPVHGRLQKTFGCVFFLSEWIKNQRRIQHLT